MLSGKSTLAWKIEEMGSDPLGCPCVLPNYVCAAYGSMPES